jgi:hypothetical protein
VTDYEFQCLLKDKKLFDSFQFYETCVFQLESAEISKNALTKLVMNFGELNNSQRETMYKKLREEKSASWNNPIGTVEYFGQSISWYTAVDKLSAEIMSLMHNFFDVYAQWINTVLFGETALPIKEVSLIKVLRKLPHYTEYYGEFITKISGILADIKYKYIADYNNTSKHRYHLDSELTYNIFDGVSNANFPVFEKDKRLYEKQDLLNTIITSIDYCKQLLYSSRQYVENYYLIRDNNHVEHRLYNPQTFLKYQNEEDFKNNKVNMHMYFIEVEQNHILPEYHIMLMNDSKVQIDAYNSIYSVIALIDKHNEYSLLGALTPKDSETFTFGDSHNLRYRAYKTNTQDYHSVLFKGWADKSFRYYPMLSKCIIIYDAEAEEASFE